MNDLVNEITSLRYAGGCLRWHTLPIHGTQSVAEHSGQAVSLMLMLHPSPSVDLIKAMMWHDTSERHAGDVPAPVRRDNPAFAEHYEKVETNFMQDTHPVAYTAMCRLSDNDRAWLKAVDVLELVMFCGDQRLLGNQHAHVVEKRAIEWLVKSESTPVPVIHFLDQYVSTKGARSYA